MYDLIVIGGGPAGYVGAIKAAQDGMKVALIEKDSLGGTCLNRGCIPTKALLHYSSMYSHAQSMNEFGIRAEGLDFDFSVMHQKKSETVATLKDGIGKLLNANKIDVFSGEGHILSADTVECNGDKLISRNILIATGSVPSVPPILGSEKAVTSDDLLDGSNTFYQRLAIVGGGVIGVEMASIYRSLGADVTIFEAMDRILPMMDRELSQSLTMVLKKRGISIYTGASVKSIEGESPLTITYTHKDNTGSIEADGILICTGRRPNTSGLLGSGISLEMNGRCIKVDEHFCTSVSGIYAVGDVNGIMPLAHAAEAQALAAVAYMQLKQPVINPSLVPSCVYTDPEIACIGLTADEAKEKSIPVRIGKYVMGTNSKTLIEKLERSYIKLIFNADTDILIGAQLFCAHATDMIAELTSAISNNMTSGDLLKGLRPHPTFVEGITEAIEASHGQSIHSMPTRR